MHICTKYLKKDRAHKEEFIRVLPPTLQDIAEGQLGHQLLKNSSGSYTCVLCAIRFTSNRLRIDMRMGFRCRPRERLQLPDTPAHLPCSLSNPSDSMLIFKGRPIHPSHKLGYRARRLFCWRCCQWSEQRVRNLRHPCKHPSDYTKRDLQRWLNRARVDNDLSGVPYILKQYITDYEPGDSIMVDTD